MHPETDDNHRPTKKRKEPTRTSARLREPDPTEPSGPYTPDPIDRTLLPLLKTLDELEINPMDIEACFEEPSRHSQILDMWNVMTPGPELRAKFAEYITPIQQYRACRGQTVDHIYRAVDYMRSGLGGMRFQTASAIRSPWPLAIRAALTYKDVMCQASARGLINLQKAACQKMLDYILFVYFQRQALPTYSPIIPNLTVHFVKASHFSKGMRLTPKQINANATLLQPSSSSSSRADTKSTGSVSESNEARPIGNLTHQQVRSGQKDLAQAVSQQGSYVEAVLAQNQSLEAENAALKEKIASLSKQLKAGDGIV